MKLRKINDVFSTPNLRTAESIAKPIKKPTQKVGLNFWQPQIDNIRTTIALYEAEIQENLDLLEEFINDVQYKN